MDRYISASKNGPRNAWWAPKPEHEHTSADADMQHEHTSSDADMHQGKMDDVIAEMNRHSDAWHSDMDSGMLKDMGRRQQTDEDSAKVASRSSTQTQQVHGAVVDIKLDSELQTASKKKGMVAKKGLGFTQASARSAPDVEATVAEQQLEDVYIHDDFGKAAEEDVEDEHSVEDNHDMKP